LKTALDARFRREESSGEDRNRKQERQDEEEMRMGDPHARGGVGRRKEARGERPGASVIDSLLQDVRYSLRALAVNRTFAVLSVLCLAVGIGTNTTIFTFVNALVLRPVPLASPAQLLSVQEGHRQNLRNAGPVSYPNFLDWKAQASDVADLAAQRPISARVSDGGEPERYSAAFVTANLFPLLGVPVALGRGFFEDEDRPGGAPVVLLSHTLWQQRYAGDPGVVGRSITVNGAPRTVIGVMPPELSSIALQRVFRGAQLWIPIGSVAQSGRGERRLTVYARLSNGATREIASARFDAVARTLEEAHPVENGGWAVSVRQLRVGFSDRTRGLMLMMMGAVTFVLLIACANVANLTLARATGRRREMATRLALGAPRSRIVRQLLTESLLIAAASIPAGVAIAHWGRHLLLGGDASPEMLADISIDRQVLLFTIGLALVTSILSGLLPALHAVRRVRHDVLKAGGRGDAMAGPSHTRLSHALIVGEVALALILLVGASLFVQSFRNLLSAEGGFDTSRILTLTIEMEADGEVPSESTARRVNDLLDRLRALPGATHVAAANLMPLRDAGLRAVVIPDHFQGRADEAPTVALGGVTSDFFGVLDVAILQGRPFTDAEGRSRSAVAVVNKTMARSLWPGADAVGRRFGRSTGTGTIWFTIVGVSDDILNWDLSDRPIPTAYVPHVYVPVREPALFIRTAGDPTLVARPARAAIFAAEPTLPTLDVSTMTEVHHAALSRNRTLASLFVVLGAIALLLGATGVYGVLSYFVSLRTHEIGIRAALGADRRMLVGLFVRRGLSITLVGVAFGLAGAWALARVVRGQLHDVSATDPLTFAGVALLLMLVGLLATYLPARRAAAVDPLVAIRE
jgi:putative ABC transport system permease protein